MEIIVVDDEPVMRQMLGRALARFGYSVTQCSSGEGAIREVENREGGALLVLDYAMPQINGAEVCQKIRSHEHPGVAQTPIILLTAFGGEERELECFKAGADDFVSKPVNLPVLKARIETHLRLALMRAQLQAQNRQLEEWRMIREFDMEAAGLVQQAMIPRKLPEIDGWKFALRCEPLIEVGGDSYDALTLPDGGLLIWIADATGHGVSAALVTVLIKLLFRHALEEVAQPAAAIERVNREFMEIFKGHSFLTVACLVLHPGEGRIRSAGAGHPPVIVVRKGGSVETLPSSAPPVGLLLPGSLQEREAVLEPGDALLMLTDGVYGVCDPEGNRYSFARLAQSLSGTQAREPEELIAAVLAQARTFSKDGPCDDDVALIAMRHELGQKKNES
jgi:sigma-B regulation protein RsbU (phosphoserine phosphatase)